MIPKDFPWRAGMQTTTGLRVFSTSGPYPLVIADDDQRSRPKVYALPFDAKPDLTDPATVGALLGAVREAWRSPHAYVRRNGTIRTDDNRIVPAWEVCDLYLDDEGARAIGASRRGSVNCALLLSEFDALLAAWNARPVKA